MTLDDLLSMDKEHVPEAAKMLAENDIKELVGLLEEKEDKLRYPSLLLLQSRSESADDVYPFFDVFAAKLKSENSYQRSIGLMLMAANARWDSQNKLDAILDDYLAGVDDEKPITVRQCIQALEQVIPFKTHLLNRIAQKIMQVDIVALRPTMQKLILLDILQVLLKIRRIKPSDDIDVYISDALLGGVLDEKSKKQVSKELNKETVDKP